MDLSYLSMRAIANYSTSLFFRDIVVINRQNVPETGAIIVYGNHNNQFVDGMLLLNTMPRKIQFIAAAKSMRRTFVGPLIQMTDAIPVQRAQDLATKGEGSIIQAKAKTIKGDKTLFTKLGEGASIDIHGNEYRIKQIVSDTQLHLEKHIEHQHSLKFPLAYKIIPKIEYSQLYENVWNCLKKEGCIGIFPEGGSHDRLELLPLKAGICIMALGAMEKYNIPVKLVACGFNYYNPQNFRSKVILQYGIPFQIPQQLVTLYRTNKKAAIATLLTQIQTNLKEVTTNIRSFYALSTLLTCRELYALKAEGKLTEQQKLHLNRRFAKGYQKLAELKNQNATKLFQDVMAFDQYARISGLPINSVIGKNGIFVDFISFLFYLVKTINRLAFALPGFILLGPTTAIITYLSEKQRIKCLKASKVKIHGNDVVGSYKILLSMTFFPFTTCLNSIAIYKLLQKFTNLTDPHCKYIALGTFVLLPFYLTFMLRSYDSLFRTFKKLKFYFLRLFRRNTYQQFYNKRRQLSHRIREIVDIHGKDVFQDFEEIRIISRDRFKSETENQVNSMEQISSPLR